MPFADDGGATACHRRRARKLQSAGQYSSRLHYLPGGGIGKGWTAAATTQDTGAGAEYFALGYPGWTTKWWSGNTFGWLQIGTYGSVWLGQTLQATLQNDTTYTLSAFVARPLNTAPPGQGIFNYSIQLYAGTTLLSSAASLLNLPANSSGTDSLSYSSGPIILLPDSR